MRELVIGHDHGFGRGRQGDVETLRRLGHSRGFAVDVVGAVASASGQQVSSSIIRRLIAGGDLDGAAPLLGRRYSVAAPVVRGEGRGRTIGFPTINLGIPAEKLLPPDGVWVVRVETSRGRFGGMMNQGHRPTFGDGRRLLEVHLFDFEGELYHRPVRVTWLSPLRATRHFASVAELQQQLEHDGERARAMLALASEDLDAPLTAPE